MKCATCGKDYSIEVKRFSNPELFINGNCFDCSFWLQKTNLPEEEKAKQVIVGGYHFFIGDEEEDCCFRGFGGRKWIIRFFDGRVVETTNLWGQGKIDSPHFMHLLKDNAVFVEPLEDDSPTFNLLQI